LPASSKRISTRSATAGSADLRIGHQNQNRAAASNRDGPQPKAKPRNLVQLSWELYQLFRRFLDRPITHPLDPIHRVPALLKKAIFALLEARAPTLVIPDKPPSRWERRATRAQAPTPP
jgi:hypothetical protein